MDTDSLGNVFRHLALIARNRFRLIRGSELCEDLAFYRERDSQENTETSPPDEEIVNLCCVWGIEFYTPAHTPDLMAGFRRLGWGANDHIDPDRDPVTWLMGLRRFQYGGSWMNLGYLVPDNTRLPFIGVEQHSTSLPTSVRYANAGMFALSPSLVSVVACFAFDEHSSKEFDEALRISRQTYTTPVKNGRQIHHPSTQKAVHIEHIRADFTQKIRNWFSEHLPGLFSSGILGDQIPTCEFVTFRKAEPFPTLTESENGSHRYLSILGMSQDFDVWKSLSVPGLKLKVPSSVERRLPYHSILAVNEARHKSALPEDFQSSSLETRMWHVDQFMSKLLTLWSILPMLEGYTRYLNEARDSMVKHQTHHGPAKVLDRLIGNVAYGVDIAAVTSELKMYAEEGFPLMHDVERFEPCDNRFYNSETDLKKQLEFIISKQVGWLQRTDASVRDHLTQYGTLLGATEDVRVQGIIKRLTWVLVGLTIVVLFAAIVPEELKKEILFWFNVFLSR